MKEKENPDSNKEKNTNSPVQSQLTSFMTTPRTSGAKSKAYKRLTKEDWLEKDNPAINKENKMDQLNQRIEV